MRFRNAEIEVLSGIDPVRTLDKVVKYASQEKDHPFIQSSIKKYNLDGSRESLKKIFDAMFRLIIFFPDPPFKQYIKTLNRTLKDRRGNCVDYSGNFGAWLCALKVPHRISIVEYYNQKVPGYSHIYVQTLGGITMDAVIGQDQEGNEVHKLNRGGFFDKEIKPIKRRIDRVVIP